MAKKNNNLNKFRILVVDDEQPVLEAYQSILSPNLDQDEHSEKASELASKLFEEDRSQEPSMGEMFDLTVCDQGDKAVEAIEAAIKKNNPFAVVFLDMRMPPGPDGLWTAKHIRALDPEIQIVVVTAHCDVRPSDITRQVPPAHKLLYVQKPFHDNEIWQLASSLGAKWLAEKEVGQYHDKLEEMVRERASELAATNESLQQEINEHKKADESLNASEEQYRMLFEMAKDSIVLIKDCKFVDCNPATLAMFGYKKDEIVGCAPFELSPEFQPDGNESKETAIELIKNTLEGIPQFFEWQHMRKDGSLFDAEIFLHRLDIEGETLVQAMLRDITERKHSEKILKDAHRELQEYDQMKNEFVINVSHELRTPLFIFKNIISNVRDGVTGRVNQRQYESLDIADKEIDRLGRIISDFLDISKIEAGKMHLRWEGLALHSIISDVIKLHESMSDEKNIEVKSYLPDEELYVDGDRDRLTQVINNLIENAIKFVPDCGGEIMVRVRDLDDEVLVEVEDNGYGIESDDISKVFNRFVQIGKHIGPGAHGTGLGLAISKELIELHGGRIWVENRPNSGANFCFVLPKCSGGKAIRSAEEGVDNEVL